MELQLEMEMVSLWQSQSRVAKKLIYKLVAIVRYIIDLCCLHRYRD